MPLITLAEIDTYAPKSFDDLDGVERQAVLEDVLRQIRAEADRLFRVSLTAKEYSDDFRKDYKWKSREAHSEWVAAGSPLPSSPAFTAFLKDLFGSQAESMTSTFEAMVESIWDGDSIPPGFMDTLAERVRRMFSTHRPDAVTAFRTNGTSRDVYVTFGLRRTGLTPRQVTETFSEVANSFSRQKPGLLVSFVDWTETEGGSIEAKFSVEGGAHDWTP